MNPPVISPPSQGRGEGVKGLRWWARYSLTLCLVSVMLLLGCGPAPQPIPPSADKKPAKPSRIAIAAASDLKFALDELIAEFCKQHPEIEPQPTYGASGSLFAQISNGAPFDLFLSADIEFPKQLIEQQRAIAESEFTYALGHLVVWVRQESSMDVAANGIQVLNNPAVRKIAMANPQTAPYGRAAEAAIQHYDLTESVKNKLVLGENISQTAQFVESGAADVGIIALSLALAPVMKDQGRYWPVPQEAHAPLVQGGVIMTKTQHSAACQQFRSFLLSDRAREVLQRYGFQRPGE